MWDLSRHDTSITTIQYRGKLYFIKNTISSIWSDLWCCVAGPWSGGCPAWCPAWCVRRWQSQCPGESSLLNSGPTPALVLASLKVVKQSDLLRVITNEMMIVSPWLIKTLLPYSPRRSGLRSEIPKPCPHRPDTGRGRCCRILKFEIF